MVAEPEPRSGSVRRKSELENKTDSFTDQAAAQLDKITTQVGDTAKAAVEHGREMGEQVQAVGKNARSALDRSLKDQPMTTLARAAVMGFLLGALWKS